MRREDSFSEFVLYQFRSMLKDKDLLIASKKNILTDTTCIFEKGKFELLHGFSQTDIVIYKEQRFDFNEGNSGINRFYGDPTIRLGILAVPFVVLELKTGALTTDSIRCRDFVAQRITNMFPFSAYYFIAEETQKEEKTLLRQGKSFTNYFISRTKINELYLTNIFKNYVEPHIKNVRAQLCIMND